MTLVPDPAAPPALVVANAQSGRGCTPAVAAELREKMAAAGLPADVELARDAGQLATVVQDAVTAGRRLVAVAGGDGTQGLVAGILAGTPVIQGVLPLGTLNHFAKDLRIPMDVDDAIRVLAGGRVARVDVGEVNGRVFVNNSSLGLYPVIVRERELQRQHLGKGKWRALASATWRALRRFEGMAVRVQSEDETQLRRTPFVFIGNNAYTMEGFSAGARERLDAGELVLYMGRRRGTGALLMLAMRALLHRLEQAADFEMLTGAAFTVSSRRSRLRVATDGELTLMDTPLQYRVRPGALQVMVPQPDQGPAR